MAVKVPCAKAKENVEYIKPDERRKARQDQSREKGFYSSSCFPVAVVVAFLFPFFLLQTN